ncbi:MAG: 30S ribosome-binding factor RbfA [Rhodothalassiaceae bacterium]
MTSRRGGGQNVRLLRVGETIRHALSDILAREQVPSPGFDVHRVTISAVEVSPDLRHADVFIVPMFDEAKDATLAALGRAAPVMRRLLARRITLKYLPELHFRFDMSFGEGDRIEALLRSERVRRDIAADPDEA